MERLIVIFGTGHGRTKIGRVTNALIRSGSGSDLCHVYVATETEVWAHKRRWATDTFIERYPNLASMVVVPCKSAEVTGGWNCVDRAVRSLRASGVPVPRHLWSPRLLEQHLLKVGYTQSPLNGDTAPCQHRNPDSPTSRKP